MDHIRDGAGNDPVSDFLDNANGFIRIDAFRGQSRDDACRSTAHNNHIVFHKDLLYLLPYQKLLMIFSASGNVVSLEKRNSRAKGPGKA
jgi:hypothetical protein